MTFFRRTTRKEIYHLNRKGVFLDSCRKLFIAYTSMKTLGEKLKELRDEKDLSLRALAKKLDVSAPFLSDVELGRRFPSDDLLAKIAKVFRIKASELKQHDSRPPITDMKRMAESDPKWGFAFRTVVDKAQKGELTHDELIKGLNKRKKKSK